MSSEIEIKDKLIKFSKKDSIILALFFVLMICLGVIIAQTLNFNNLIEICSKLP